MKLYMNMMTTLIKMRTEYVDLQHEAIKNNDSNNYNCYKLKIEKIDELMEKVRNNFNNWNK